MPSDELRFPEHKKVFLTSEGGIKPIQLPSSGIKARVLIGYADPAYTLVIFQALGEAGYEVVVAVTGSDAIAELRKADHPALAILDCRMSGMEGTEICKRMRDAEKDVYLILTSEKPTTEEIVAGLESGADLHLPKAIPLEELLAHVKVGMRAIRRQALSEELSKSTGDRPHGGGDRGIPRAFGSATLGRTEHEEAPGKEVWSLPGAPPLVEAAQGTAEGSVSVEEGRSEGATKGRVLLLEDDPSLREVMSDFLTENGYTVVAVQSGGEGVQEVLNGDFLVIFCDLMLPGFPGDMFYRAIQRIRPQLCERFVFMTGYRSDSKVSDFVKSVHGYMLQKPFHLKNLADALAVAEVRATHVSLFASEPTESGGSGEPSAAALDLPKPPQTSPQAPVMGGHELSSGERASFRKAGQAYLSPPKPAAEWPSAMLVTPNREAAEQTKKSFEWRKLSEQRAPLILVIGVALIGAFFAQWRTNLENRYRELTTDLGVAERGRAALAQALAEAEPHRKKLQELLSLPKRLEQQRTSPQWTPVLRSIVRSHEGDIELQGLHAHQMDDKPGACDVRIDGVAFGPNARVSIDHFRHKIEQELQHDQSSEPVKTGFLRFAEEAESSEAASEQKRITFEIAVTVGVKDPDVFKHSFRQ